MQIVVVVHTWSLWIHNEKFCFEWNMLRGFLCGKRGRQKRKNDEHCMMHTVFHKFHITTCILSTFCCVKWKSCNSKFCCPNKQLFNNFFIFLQVQLWHAIIINLKLKKSFIFICTMYIFFSTWVEFILIISYIFMHCFTTTEI